MCQPPSNEAVREILGTAIPPEVTVEKVQPVPTLRPQRIFQVDCSDNTSLHFVTSPYSKWRPLRSDHGMVLSETIAVRWIKERAEQRFPSRPPSAASSTPKDKNETDEDDPENEEQKKFAQLIPNIIHHGQETSGNRDWYTFYTPSTGRPLALLNPPLSPADRDVETGINFQLGRLYRQLARLSSPTGRFGPVAATIPANYYSAGGSGSAPSSPSFQRQQQQHLGAVGGLFGTVGAATWQVAFHSMLESSLRDGEDMAVVLSYPTIRRHFRRLGYLLDEVTTPRLVVVDAGDENNILVEEQEETEEGQKGWQLVGLRDWSSCVFGDPLLGAVFSDPELAPQQPPSSEFLRGFNQDNHTTTTQSSSAEPTMVYPLNLNRTVIEDVDTAWVRLLLYQVYHAVTRIVAEFYRPRADSGARELDARRRLNVILAKLAEVPDDVKSSKRVKHPRPSGEMSPAKRLRALPAPEGSN
ncbi:hypothetical protein QBC43DRAFT_221598 [Cladorrhinum sp. PSN259]|nr:hypothetical protein QBC43DRAFT_221598 [Cladorrhinum sp. PSN259]